MKIIEPALRHFPFGDRGQEGAQAAHSTALIHRMLRQAAMGAPRIP
jgi:hypothetical protein